MVSRLAVFLLTLVLLTPVLAQGGWHITGRDYKLVPVFGALSLLYLASLALVKKKKLPFSRHIAFWNIALLSAFLVTAGLGIVLVLRLSYGIMVALPFDMIQIHVIFGNALATIALFHISWHLGYFRRLLKI